jgi:hypothetical protein
MHLGAVAGDAMRRVQQLTACSVAHWLCVGISEISAQDEQRGEYRTPKHVAPVRITIQSSICLIGWRNYLAGQVTSIDNIGFVLVTLGLTLYQEGKTERALKVAARPYQRARAGEYLYTSRFHFSSDSAGQ